MNLFQNSPNLVELSAQKAVAKLRLPQTVRQVAARSPSTPVVPKDNMFDDILKRARIRQIEQERLLSSHWTFHREVLGNTNLDAAHKDLCDFLDEKIRYKLILMPRGSLKTTMVTIGSTTKRIVENPNSRTLIVSELLKNSKKMLGAVQGQFESNPKLIEMFDNLVPKRDQDKWNDTEMNVTSRTLYQAKEANCTAAGLDVEQTSTHYDRILLDDLMSRNNSQTKEQIEGVIEYVRLVYALLDPGPNAEMIVIGTRWHFADLYNYLIEEGKYAVFRMGAYTDETKTVLSFPNILTKPFLDEQRELLGPGHFANQYLNIPMDDDSAKFKEEYFQTFTDADVPKGCYVTTTIDPAISKEPTADETFIVTVATDHQNNWYVLEERHGRWDPFEMTTQLFEAVGLWHPHQVGLEKHGFQQTLQYFFEQEMARRNQFFHIEELKVDSQTSKERRIEGLVPLFAAKKIFIRDKQSEMAWQLRRYPKYPHDDGADALSHQLQLVGTGSKLAHTKEVKEGSLMALHQREARRTMLSNNWSFPMASKPGMIQVW